MIQIRNVLLTGVILASLGFSAHGQSTMMAVTSKLAAANEMPTNQSMGTGTLVASLDTATKVLSWTVSYADMTGPVKAGHFHGPAAMDQNSGVVLGFTGSMESPIKGDATLTDAQIDDLMAGKWYVNLHTAANPGGEIRGQANVTP